MDIQKHIYGYCEICKIPIIDFNRDHHKCICCDKLMCESCFNNHLDEKIKENEKMLNVKILEKPLSVVIRIGGEKGEFCKKCKYITIRSRSVMQCGGSFDTQQDYICDNPLWFEKFTIEEIYYEKTKSNEKLRCKKCLEEFK